MLASKYRVAVIPSAFTTHYSFTRSSKLSNVARTNPLRTQQPFRPSIHVRPVTVSAQPPNSNQDSADTVNYNKEFGYSRKDIILIGVGLIAFGYVLYYGLQYSGMDAGMAGNWVQLIIFLGICVGWIGSYLYRVATKQMTYAKQLDEYEEAVMKKRLEEMPDAELEAVMEEIEREKAKYNNTNRSSSSTSDRS